MNIYLSQWVCAWCKRTQVPYSLVKRNRYAVENMIWFNLVTFILAPTKLSQHPATFHINGIVLRIKFTYKMFHSFFLLLFLNHSCSRLSTASHEFTCSMFNGHWTLVLWFNSIIIIIILFMVFFSLLLSALIALYRMIAVSMAQIVYNTKVLNACRSPNEWTKKKNCVAFKIVSFLWSFGSTSSKASALM